MLQSSKVFRKGIVFLSSFRNFLSEGIWVNWWTFGQAERIKERAREWVFTKLGRTTWLSKR